MQVNIEWHLAKNGEQTLKINEYFIHSKYNPSREAQQIAEKKYIPHKGQVIFGYGAGHLVRAFELVRHFNEPIFVVDPLFNRELIKPDQANNIYYLDLDFLQDFELNMMSLGTDFSLSYNIVSTANYDKIFGEQYKQLLSNFKNLQSKNLINDYTLLRYSYSWYQNLWANLFNLKHDSSAKVLEKKYTVPAVVVSGGPSLTKQLPLLKQFRERLLVICAGSTINSLLAEQIEPDYIVTIDGGNPNYVHFKDIKLAQAKIVYVLHNHHLVRESFQLPGYLIDSSGFPIISNFVKNKVKLDLPIILGAASVANTAFSFANYITSGPIALIGQDLAYTDNLTHAKSNKHARAIDEAFIKMKQAFKVEGYYGEEVWTEPIMDGMRLEFEKIVKLTEPMNNIYNCTEGGTKINYFTQIPFEQFCKDFTQSKVEVVEVEAGEALELELVARAELKGYEELLEILRKNLKILQRNGDANQFNTSDLNKLGKNDKKINKLVNSLTIETVIAPMLTRINKGYLAKVGETPEEAFKRAYLQMQDFYLTLEKQVLECKALLIDLMEKRN